VDKFWSYRLVCYMLYGDLPYIDKLAPGYFVLDTAACCKANNIPPSRLREYLRDAERLLMIDELHLTRGIARIKLAKPLNI